LDYDPETGLFTWKVNRRGRFARVGSKAGTDNGDGQIRINVDGTKHVAHRLAWLYMTGTWPPGLIDHRNLVRSDNRWSNLRLATKSENMANRRAPANNKSGLKGVSRHSQCDRWTAQICKDGQRVHLGLFKTKEEAHAAYTAAAAEMYGEFARVR
jgi:hypothetical protein